MEAIVVLGIIAFLIWLIARGRRRTPISKSPNSSQASMGAASVTLAREPVTEATRLPNSDECWVSPGRDITVAGYRIPGGMVYVGKGLSSVTGYRVEPALIDPSLPIASSKPDRSGGAMTYWPSYSAISPECRAAYLEWLATGRRDPSAYIGYVFLFFYGLERRALVDALRSEQARQDVPVICREARELLQIYTNNSSFRNYANQFLDVLNVIAENGPLEPPTEQTGYDLPVSLRVGIGRIVAAGKPLPADWALSWFLMHPETSLRAPAKRCPGEFRELFHVRYAREFRDGLVLKPNRSRLKIAITPASASFGGQVELTMDLPDIAAFTAPVSKLRQIGEGCAADLEAFSRWVGRNADAPRTIAAVALLPRELATTHQSQEAQELWDWIGKTISGTDRAMCSADDLLRHCASFGSGKLAKSEAVLLAQLLEKGGYGIEPDVRFGGPSLAPGGVVVIFKLPRDSTAIASPQYAAATVLLHLAVAVSTADDSISEAEQQHLERHMQHALALSDSERVRLSAHLARLTKSRPALTGLKKRVDPLDLRQRSAIADLIVGVAGADGHISPEEIKVLGKIYPILGLQAEDVYSHVHAMAAGAAPIVEGGEPVTVIPAQPSTGYVIPSRPGPAQTIQLDMIAVEAKLAESAKVAAILGDIFTEEDEPNASSQILLSTSTGKLPAVQGLLLSRLAERSEWSRTEYEAMAAECGLMPDGTIDILNEAAFEHAGVPLLEGEDPIQVNVATAKELLT